jgi:hypothetical protein
MIDTEIASRAQLNTNFRVFNTEESILILNIPQSVHHVRKSVTVVTVHQAGVRREEGGRLRLGLTGGGAGEKVRMTNEMEFTSQKMM